MQEILNQFLTNIAKPEYDKVWQEVEGTRGAGTSRTRQKKDAVISAANFLKKFTQRSKLPPISRLKQQFPQQAGVVTYGAPSAEGYAAGEGAAAVNAGSSQETVVDWDELLGDLLVDSATARANAAPQSDELLRKAQKQLTEGPRPTAPATVTPAAATDTTAPAASVSKPTSDALPSVVPSASPQGATAKPGPSFEYDVDALMEEVGSAGGDLGGFGDFGDGFDISSPAAGELGSGTGGGLLDDSGLLLDDDVTPVGAAAVSASKPAGDSSGAPAPGKAADDTDGFMVDIPDNLGDFAGFEDD